MVMKISRAGTKVLLAGVIDEHSDFTPLLQEQDPLSLDFSGIERINSIGLRNWMRFVSQWGDKPLKYLECPVIITDQLAVIPSLRGIKSRVAQVLSAFLAYECSKCQHEDDVRIEQNEVYPDVQSRVMNPPCAKCHGTMDLINPEQLVIFEP